MENKRSSFSGKLGYVMAVAGSAVGLGNIWRFPYLAAKYGGGIFILTYFILAITFGFALLVSETTLGRKTGKSPIAAFKKLGAKKLKFGGYLNAIIPMLIVPYYCVVGGWVCKYFYEYIIGNGASLITDTYFTEFVGTPFAPIVGLLAFAIIVFIVVILGVEGGIEKVSKLLMPLLVFMAIAISIYTLTTPGAMEGVKYYLIPDFSKFSIMTVVAAMGQLFYSLSLGMGILYTYGSYMKKDVDIESSIGQVEIMDTLVAFLAGLMIVPAVFAFAGGTTETLQAGPSLMFITMPKVFGTMAFGNIIATVFFMLVLFAALTSAISLMECCVSTLRDQLNWSRLKSAIVVLIGIIIIGIPCSLGFGVLDFITILDLSILDFFDFITNSVMMPISAICTSILILKVTGLNAIFEEIAISGKFKRKKIYVICMRYVVIPGLLVVCISSILSVLKIITI